MLYNYFGDKEGRSGCFAPENFRAPGMGENFVSNPCDDCHSGLRLLVNDADWISFCSKWEALQGDDKK